MLPPVHAMDALAEAPELAVARESPSTRIAGNYSPAAAGLHAATLFQGAPPPSEMLQDPEVAAAVRIQATRPPRICRPWMGVCR